MRSPLDVRQKMASKNFTCRGLTGCTLIRVQHVSVSMPTREPCTLRRRRRTT
ncbi:hypothetical protein DPMN_129143 [Dreissena polymorpha]|uniref:Uncharacterized protein n=1 Tax=Dreissena polymorpha TaxID=45954 RepID=A0A9D4H242_DREPO|nr:hypothetical protein DPMN_129143 [Dreissena polymorpha]